MIDKKYGHFEQDGREFAVTERKTPVTGTTISIMTPIMPSFLR